MRSFTLNQIVGYVVFERVMITSCKSLPFRNLLLANVEIKVLISCSAKVMSIDIYNIGIVCYTMTSYACLTCLLDFKSTFTSLTEISPSMKNTYEFPCIQRKEQRVNYRIAQWHFHTNETKCISKPILPYVWVKLGVNSFTPKSATY